MGWPQARLLLTHPVDLFRQSEQQNITISYQAEIIILMIIFFISPCTGVVTVLPENQAVSYPNGAINFFCLSSSSSIIVSVNWMLNNTFLNDMPDSSDISAEFSSAVGGTLRFFRVSKMYNSTEIRCIASLSTGDTVNSSDVSTLLLQGITI